MAVRGNPLAGVSVDPLPSDMKGKAEGVLVSEVTVGSLADTSGLEEGDIIVGVNQQPINSVKSFERMVEQVEQEPTVLVLLNRATTNMFLIVGPDD